MNRRRKTASAIDRTNCGKALQGSRTGFRENSKAIILVIKGKREKIVERKYHLLNNTRGVFFLGQALFKQSNGLVAVDVVAACGVLTAGQFLGLAEAVKDARAGVVKLTSRQTVVVLVGESEIDAFSEKIAGFGLRISPYGNSVRCVKACSGTSDLCPRALSNALDLGIELQNKYIGQPVPKDFKISVAGCQRGCTDPYCADFGLIACGRDFYKVAIGGRGGSSKPEHGEIIMEKLHSSNVPEVLDYILAEYRKLAEPEERLCKTISRIGLQKFIPPTQDGSLDEIKNEEFSRFLMSEE